MKKKTFIICFVFVIFFFAGSINASIIDENDFASDMISYSPGIGAGLFIFPHTALGSPAVDTDYNFSDRPIVPVFPQCKIEQIVTVGVGGHLTLKFNHKVCDDKNNPYGFDFIIFGNPMLVIGSGPYEYGDPYGTFLISGQASAEPGRVSVSQDGINWFSFNNGPFADSFAPTLGRIFDPNNPAYYPGWENLWWAERTDPTLPYDPNIEPNDFKGKSLAEVCLTYGKSAGGTAFDLKDLADFNNLSIDPNSGVRWIQYIKIECIDTNSNGDLPDIDAVSDVSCCGDYRHPFPAGDIDRNCSVDLADLEILCRNWMLDVNNLQTEEQGTDLYPDSDNIINFKDFAVLAASWLQKTWP